MSVILELFYSLNVNHNSLFDYPYHNFQISRHSQENKIHFYSGFFKNREILLKLKTL